MKVLITAYYEFLKHVRDIKMLVVLIIFPILMILILGTAVEGFFSNDAGVRISVGYVNLDKGGVGRGLDGFLKAGEISKLLELTKYGDKSQGQKALDEGKNDAMIYLAEDLSQDVLEGKRGSIQVYGNKNVELVENILNNFTSSFNAANAAVEVSGPTARPEAADGSVIKRMPFSKNTAPKVIDYYSVLTLLQILIMGALFGVFITGRTYGSDIHIRNHSLPVGKWTLLSGRIIGSVFFLLLASIVTVVFTKVVYHANWDGNPLIILGVILVFCGIAVGIGVLIGLFTSGFSGMMAVLLLMTFFGIVSGAISPRSTNNLLGLITPNYYAKVLIFGTIYGYSGQLMTKTALGLLGYAAVVYGAVAVLLRRPGYDNI